MMALSAEILPAGMEHLWLRHCGHKGDDLCELRRHTFANSLDGITLKKLVRRVFKKCRCREIHEKHLQVAQEASFADDGIDYQQLDVDCMAAAEHSNGPNNAKSVMESAEMAPSHDEANRVKPHADGGSEDNMVVVECANTSPERPNNSPKSGKSSNTRRPEMGKASDSIQINGAVHAPLERTCPGHERALIIQQLIQDLDIKEEGISTLLCYLELHDKDWLESLSPVYATCSLQCYGGPSQLQTVARKCPPVAVAIAKSKAEGKKFAQTNHLEFQVVDISDAMGWDSGPVKRELKLLPWNLHSAGSSEPSRSGVLVEFSDLAFHFRSVGDMTDDELDEVLEFLHRRVTLQEKTELYQLQAVYDALHSVSHRSFWMCSDDFDQARNDKLKSIIFDYFEKQMALTADGDPLPTSSDTSKNLNLGQLRSDVNQFINMYAVDHSLTGRVIARIFHGIGSPCFPAEHWGRVRRFWRCNLNTDFNLVMKVGTQELIKHRK